MQHGRSPFLCLFQVLVVCFELVLLMLQLGLKLSHVPLYLRQIALQGNWQSWDSSIALNFPNWDMASH